MWLTYPKLERLSSYDALSMCLLLLRPDVVLLCPNATNSGMYEKVSFVMLKMLVTTVEKLVNYQLNILKKTVEQSPKVYG